jgi:hypothetical protein
MQIALIGWGSLIWCPGCLRIKSRWHSDGPRLPIEFARKSSDGRLTLVIHLDSPEQPTYWALSEFDTLECARKNLKEREGTSSKNIHSLTADGQEGAVDPRISANIREWLRSRRDVHAAIWTGLPSNWERQPFIPEDAVAYLQKLENERGQAKATYARAHEYVTNAPSQIQTPVRRMVRKMKGWEDVALSRVLFEVGTVDEDSSP